MLIMVIMVMARLKYIMPIKMREIRQAEWVVIGQGTSYMKPHTTLYMLYTICIVCHFYILWIEWEVQMEHIDPLTTTGYKNIYLYAN